MNKIFMQTNMGNNKIKIQKKIKIIKPHSARHNNILIMFKITTAKILNSSLTKINTENFINFVHNQEKQINKVVKDQIIVLQANVKTIKYNNKFYNKINNNNKFRTHKSLKK